MWSLFVLTDTFRYVFSVCTLTDVKGYVTAIG
jgi:hypothetical protein